MGAGQPDPGAAASQLTAGQEVLATTTPMLIDEPDRNPEAVQPDPGAMQSDQGATPRATPAWAQPLIDYLTHDVLPEAEVHARQVLHHAKAYTIINGELYKRSVAGIYQRRVDPVEGRWLLEDIHKGEIGRASCRERVYVLV